MKNKAVNAPIKFEEIVKVMINRLILPLSFYRGNSKQRTQNLSKTLKKPLLRQIHINFIFFVLFCFGAKKVRGTGFPVWAARKIKRERKHEEGEGEGKGKRYAGYVSNRDLKIRSWRRQQNLRRKSEFAFFQSSSRLLQVTNFVKCR